MGVNLTSCCCESHEGALQRPVLRQLQGQHPALRCWLKCNLVLDGVAEVLHPVNSGPVDAGFAAGPGATAEFMQYQAAPVAVPRRGHCALEAHAKATSSDIDSELMSPGLIVSLRPVVPRLVSIGTAQNGEDIRGNSTHMAIASGAA